MPKNNTEHVEAGFILHRHSSELKLLLPTSIVVELAEERAASEERELAELERAAETHRTEPFGQTKRGYANPDRELADAIRSLGEDAPPAHEPWRTHQVYNVSELEKLSARIDKITDGDQRKLLRNYLRRFVKSGVLRSIARPADVDRLDVVSDVCPNFAEAVDIVRGELRAAEAALRAPHIPPLLLLGDPGVGKTHFCQVLASQLGAPHFRLSFDSAVASTALSGVDPQWGTAKAGLMLDAVCAGDVANPVIVLDEIDKCVRSRNDDALAPLHTLLERSSALSFRDIFADFEFDASLVTWIATANDADAIPSTLRSRFTEILISPPAAADAIRQAIAIAREVMDKEAPSGFECLDRRLCVDLAHLTPRELKKALCTALRRAVDNGRLRIERLDFPRGLFDDAAEHTAGSWLH